MYMYLHIYTHINIFTPTSCICICNVYPNTMQICKHKACIYIMYIIIYGV